MKQMVDLIAVEHAVNRLINKRKRDLYKENEVRIKEDVEIQKEYLKKLNEKAFNYKNIVESFYSYAKSNIAFDEPYFIDEILDLKVKDEYTYDEFICKFEKLDNFYSYKIKELQMFIIRFLNDNIIKLNNNKILSNEDISGVICHEEFCYIISSSLESNQSGNKEIIFKRKVNSKNYNFPLNSQPTSTDNNYDFYNIFINDDIIETMKNLIESKLN